MKKSNNYSFDEDYNVKTSIVVVIRKVVLAEIVLASIAFLFNFFVFSGGNLVVKTSSTFYIGSFFLVINLTIFICLFLGWNYRYYVISQDGISSNTGVVFRKTKSIDIPSIRSISINQGFFGRIFNYGTIVLESPVLSEKFYMHYLPTPFRHATLIENARAKALKDGKVENIIIGTKP